MSFYEPETFASASEASAAASERVLQPVWEWLIDGRQDALRSPLFPPLLAVVFYFLVTGFFTALDLCGQHWSWLARFRIQKQRHVTWALVCNTLVNAFWNHVLLIFPLAMVQLIWVPPTPLPPVAPTLWQFLWHQVVWFFIFDAYYWAWHALHHKVKPLYRWVHSIHHQHSAPFALTTQYLHPWEILSVGLGITVIPWAFAPHCMTYWSWFILANWVSIEVHLGYDFPWAAHNWIPIYGGAPSHDMHHMRPLSNFEPWLNYLDNFMGWKLTKAQLSALKEAKAKKWTYSEEDSKDLKKWN